MSHADTVWLLGQGVDDRDVRVDLDGLAVEGSGAVAPLADGSKRGFLQHFPAPDYLGLAPLGFVTADARQGCLILSTFHTFPGEYTVVKTQSLIERIRS